MTEWTKGDWATVAVGQRVRLTNVDGAVEFTVKTHRQTRDCWHLDSEIGEYSEWGWNLFVPVPPKPEPTLPTEPGTYWADRDGDAWLCSHSGMVALAADTTRLTDSDSKMFKADHYAPFVRLEPRSVTATAILKRLQNKGIARFEQDAEATYTLYSSDFAEVAAEFGAEFP